MFQKLAKVKRRRGRAKDGGSAPAKKDLGRPQSKRKASDRDRVPFSRDSQSDPKKQRKQGRQPVSAEALELSSQLKQLSKEKKWNEALSVYQDPSNKNIRDSHHACIMVDMAARCGRISEGEQIYNQLALQKAAKISVELKTALIKGYAHSGMLRKADILFHEMCNSPRKMDHPNVRTLNTLLRGCLWCAVSAHDRGHDNLELVGGIVSAQRAWNAYKMLQEKGDSNAVVDVSSYEYYITMLCQALRLQDAQIMIGEMKAAFGFASNDNSSTACDDQSATEALAVVYLALGRGHAVLGEVKEAITACKQSLSFATTSKIALKSDSSFSRKRAWNDKSGEENRRVESNAVYRDHRLSEISSEAKTIIEICQKSTSIKDTTARDVTRRIATRLVCLSGGGTTEHGGKDDATQDLKLRCKTVKRNLMNAVYSSFGLSASVSKLDVLIAEGSSKVLTKKEMNRIWGSIGLQGGIVNDDGFLELRRIFSAGIGPHLPKKRIKRIEVELGAGFGDWIVRKSIENPSINYVAVELRADRVAQIFARTAILSINNPINNLVCVNDDSQSFLTNALQPESIDTIYVNHPEPPTQTYGAESDKLKLIAQGGEEPAHMLHSSVLIAAAKALKKGSKFIIVTDNRWYGRLICATLRKVKGSYPGLMEDYNLAQEDSSFQTLESDKEEEPVPMYEGQPNETIGYPSQRSERGESYFDRLWRAGGGIHADRRSRFIIVQKKGHGNSI